MASRAYERILSVQELDISFARVMHRRDTHPGHGQVKDLEAQISKADEGMVQLRSSMDGLKANQRKLQAESAGLEQKRNDINDKLYSGAVSANKELLALQKEEAQALEQLDALESQQLEVMLELEQLESDLESLSAEREELIQRLSEDKDKLATLLDELVREGSEIEQQRSTAAAAADSELLKRYEELRSDYDGVVLARLLDGACEGCNIKLSAVAMDQALKMAADAVLTCEECGRILIR